MNKILINQKSTRIVIIYELVKRYRYIDVLKLCFMTSIISRIGQKSFNSLNDIFQFIADCIRCGDDELSQILYDVEFLENNGILRIEKNKALLLINNEISCLRISDKTGEILEQLNTIDINSLVRFIAQYV